MKKVLALIVLCFIAFNSHAQLKYQNGYLVYNITLWSVTTDI